MIKDIAIVAYDAGVRHVLTEMLREVGYEVASFKFVSEVPSGFDGFVFYHNRGLNVHHMHAVVTQVVPMAETVFMGHFGTVQHEQMINMPFSKQKVLNALCA